MEKSRLNKLKAVLENLFFFRCFGFDINERNTRQLGWRGVGVGGGLGLLRLNHLTTSASCRSKLSEIRTSAVDVDALSFFFYLLHFFPTGLQLVLPHAHAQCQLPHPKGLQHGFVHQNRLEEWRELVAVVQFPHIQQIRRGVEGDGKNCS